VFLAIVNKCVEDVYQATSLQPSHQQKLEHPQFTAIFTENGFLRTLGIDVLLGVFKNILFGENVYWQLLEQFNHQ